MFFDRADGQFDARLPKLVLSARVLAAVCNSGTRSACRIVALLRWCERERDFAALGAYSSSRIYIKARDNMRLETSLMLFHVAPFDALGGEF